MKSIITVLSGAVLAIALSSCCQQQQQKAPCEPVCQPEPVKNCK